MNDVQEMVDWVQFERSRAELGPGLIRILGYFREDGVKSLGQIEQAMREQNTAALVIPAHTLKGEARQLGAEPLAKIAELIETTARFCVRAAVFPTSLCRRSSSFAARSTRPSTCSTRPPIRCCRVRARSRPASAARRTTRTSAGSRPLR